MNSYGLIGNCVIILTGVTMLLVMWFGFFGKFPRQK